MCQSLRLGAKIDETMLLEEISVIVVLIFLFQIA